MVGNTESSFTKKEHESVSKSTIGAEDISNITMDAMDLNELISATQKRLDSFKSGYKSPPPPSSSHEIKKMTTSVSSEKKTEESFSSFNSNSSGAPCATSFLDSNTMNSGVNYKKV